LHWSDIKPFVYLKIILSILLIIFIIISMFFFVVRMNNVFVEAKTPNTFNGTISDMKVHGVYFLFWKTSYRYKLVVVNGTEEKRMTFTKNEMEQHVFGQVEKELIFHVGDNVTLTYQYFDWDIIHQKQYRSNN
jgi:hypothetical protein